MRWCWSTRRTRWAFSASTAAAWYEDQGSGRRRRFRRRHLLQVGRHGRRVLCFEPPQVRDHALRLPALHLHRLAAAIGRRDRSDVDPQAHARRSEARTAMGKCPQTPPRADRNGLHPRHQDAGFSDHRGDARGPAKGRRDVAGAARGRALRQYGAPPATPAGTFLLRCSLCAEHSTAQIEAILGMFQSAGRAVGAIG